MGKHSQTFLSVFLLSLSLSAIIHHHTGFSQSTAAQNYKNLCCPLIHCDTNKNLIYIIKISHTKLLFSLCTPGDVKHSQTFLSLSLSLQNLCNLPQRKVVSTQLQNSKRVTTGPKRVTTGPNGLERVPSQRVPTGSNGGGGEERSMTRLLSPHNNIIYIIYLKKFYFYSYFFSLSAIIHHSKIFIYKKKNL
jgi:hypothetical protein